jgi:hypothetical protein
MLLYLDLSSSGVVYVVPNHLARRGQKRPQVKYEPSSALKA